ncbi:hypothetical protein BOTNAR_0154g00090 [Botryotinia narcissicola]|uniref:Uncharacterized protein n=1 Tax=Botryotinia narcissicola TaxID=278944 RepID=A0A4Z1IE47_9HELO|nr:hypothetical protein BOTNAR_0154g00090 [Botryotinia narcissicola]
MPSYTPSNVRHWNEPLETPFKTSQKSELECVLASCSVEIQTVECLNFERTSKYSARIGQVSVRIVSRTYMALDEIETENLQFNPPPMLNAQELSSVSEFSITITRTETILHPESWEQARGTVIKLHEMDSPSMIDSSLTLALRTFSDFGSQPPNDAAAGNILDNKFVASQFTGVKGIASQFLLYVAFKAVLVAQGVRHRKPRRRKSRKPRRSTSFLHQSPDSGVNEVIELTTLWIEI